MVTVNATTVCCADPNKGPDTQQSAEGVSGCTCIHREPGKSLDDLIQAWAKESDSQGSGYLLSEACLACMPLRLRLRV